jgi:chemotaxis signal transduction protein
MSDKLLDQIKGGSFGFADDFFGDEPESSEPAFADDFQDDEDDISVWYESANQTPKLDLLAFVLDGRLYGLALSSVRTIIQEPLLTPYPSNELKLLGGFQHGNEIYPLIDLYSVIRDVDVESDQSDVEAVDRSELKPKVALVEFENRVIGLFIPAVHKAFRVELTELEAAPQDGKQVMFDAVVPVDGSSVYVVSVAAVFRSLGVQ